MHHGVNNLSVKSQNAEKRACSFAVRKIDVALATIAASYTRHEGIYNACQKGFLDFQATDHLPPSAQSLLVEFFNTRAPLSSWERIDEARAAVSVLTKCESMRFVDELLLLKTRLERIHHSLYKPTQKQTARPA